jgi:dTMP kinase
LGLNVPDSSARGPFITFEGMEGSGKTTQLAFLAQWLREEGHTVVTSREPGGSSIGSALRGILLNPEHTHLSARCEALLYMADRAQHLSEIIEPARRNGHWVLLDRYHDSTLAYQGLVRGVEGLDYHFFPQPDFTLLLDIPAEIGLQRALRRNHEEHLEHESRFEQEDLHFHQKVRDAFHQLAQRWPSRFLVLPAQQDRLTLHQAILEGVLSRFASRLIKKERS